MGHSTVAGASTGGDLVALHLGDHPTIESLLHTKFQVRNPDLSPDGHWLAYESNETGAYQVCVRPFPNVDGGWWQISTQGGTSPLWAKNGREVFYLDGDGYLTTVPVQAGPGFTRGNPARLLQTRYYNTAGRTYDASRDGQKFLMIKPGAQGASAPPSHMVLVLHEDQELRRLVPGK